MLEQQEDFDVRLLQPFRYSNKAHFFVKDDFH